MRVSCVAQRDITAVLLDIDPIFELFLEINNYYKGAPQVGIYTVQVAVAVVAKAPRAWKRDRKISRK